MTTKNIIEMLNAIKNDIDHRDFIPIDGSFDSKTKTLKSTIDKVTNYWLNINDTEYLDEMRSAAISAVKELIVGLYRTRAEAQVPRVPIQYA